VDAGGDSCVGCGRTLGEIGAWAQLSPAGRAAVLRRIRSAAG
jgi:predicted Fe-S protein YdhL (DUF1289 family)